MKKYLLILFVIIVACKKPDNTTSLVVLYVPNTFTPNQDNLNDEFRVAVSDPTKMASFNLKIYNQNQVVIFQTNDANTGWNGQTSNNGHLFYYPTGTYPYTIKYTDTDQNTSYKTGEVMLLR